MNRTHSTTGAIISDISTDISTDSGHAEDSSRSSAELERLVGEFEKVLDRLESARPFSKALHQPKLLSLAQRLLGVPGGVSALYGYAPRFDAAGVFAGGDWDHPDLLQPVLVRDTLLRDDDTTPVECLSQLRLLAIACGDASHPDVAAEDARALLEEALAHNLDLLFAEATEVTRASPRMAERLERLFQFITDRLGTSGIVSALVLECQRVLLQRPIMVQRVAEMLRAAARALPAEPESDPEPPGYADARWLIAALDGPTALSREHSSPEAYRGALAALDAESLAQEAGEMGRTMDASGLVSPAHAVLLRYVADAAPQLLGPALALTRIGVISLAEYEGLIRSLVERAVTPGTARCIYGLSRLLNRGILFFQPVPPGLLRVLVLPILPAAAEQLRAASGLDDPPDANALLLAGTLSVLGQPRGVDQGHNPTCQAARAISLWSQNDVGYLLDLIACAGRDGDVVMHFEGDTIRSSELTVGLAEELHPELDAVSLLLTPHLDKIYMEMSQRTIGRGEDGHRWVNPAFHGWWVYHSFASLVDTATRAITGFDAFVRQFHAAYHPAYNGGLELVYAQPCGVVSTTAHGAFVGWHAVSIQRVDRDPNGVWRVYFFNPNRDKGQDWGNGIVTSTHDHGELEGESSLPFEQFAMRLYVFHYRLRESGDPAAVPAETVAGIRDGVAASWGAHFGWAEEDA